MVALPYTDKIAATGPARSSSFRVERFQTDSYTIRGTVGINVEDITYQLTWVCLTRAEADALSNTLAATRGISLIQWTPPLENEELNFTVTQYDAELTSTAGSVSDYLFNVTATLKLEYDLV